MTDHMANNRIVCHVMQTTGVLLHGEGLLPRKQFITHRAVSVCVRASFDGHAVIQKEITTVYEITMGADHPCEQFVLNVDIEVNMFRQCQ